MANGIFVDASAWIAVTLKTDNNHEAATQVYPEILSNYARLVTTNLVVAETYNLIRYKMGHAPAMQYLDRLKSARLDQVYSDALLEGRAIAILRRYSDQDFSYADAISFALMQERGLQEAFTFDHHFAVMGFRHIP